MSNKQNILELIRGLENAGVNIIALLGGFFGALASLIFDEERYSTQRAIGIVLMGAIAAGFLTPLISYWMNLSHNFQGSVSFLVGLIVMRVSDKTLDLIKEIDLQTILDLIKRKK